ncbi:MAG: DUF5050 domain-containing protein [Myxococcales bacterium]
MRSCSGLLQPSWSGLLLTAALLGACGDDPQHGGPTDAGTQDGSQQMTDEDGGPQGDGDANPEPGSCSPKGGPKFDDLKKSGKGVDLGFEESSGFVYQGDFYFHEDTGGLKRIKAGSTTVETVTSKPGSSIIDGMLYATDADGTHLTRVPLATPDATPEVQGGTMRGFPTVVQGDSMYGFDDVRDATHDLWKQDFKTGVVTVLASVKEEFGGMDVADGYAYYTDNTFGVEQLFRVPTAGGKPERISSKNQHYFDLQTVKVIGDKVYWADGYSLHVTQIGAADPMTGTETFGGYGPGDALSSVSNGTRGASRITERGDRIYWVDDNGNFGWTSKDRKSCGVVASFSFGGGGSLVAYGGDSFYATNNFENIWRFPLE